jgi:PAS domain S-box-containing protein
LTNNNICRLKTGRRLEGRIRDDQVPLMRPFKDSDGHYSNALAAALDTPPDAQTCFRDLLDKVNLIAVTIDRDARITYCNEFFLRLTGWTFAEIDGRNWHELFVPPSIEDLRPLFADMFLDLPETWHHENDIFTRTGERRSVRWNNIILRDSLGVAVAAGSIGEDVTDRKHLERALADCNVRERDDLEKELHDGLGQELVGIALLARSLATSVGRDHRDIAQDLQHLSIIASQAVESCRKIARGFAPFSEMQGGLVQAIKQLTAAPGKSSRAQLEFSVSQTAPLLLSAEACDHVYHLAQEALAIAIEHSGAASVKVDLQIHPTLVSVTILDDGTGISKLGELGPGLGTKMMHHRAALLQATLRVELRDTGGTRLVLTCGQPASVI